VNWNHLAQNMVSLSAFVNMAKKNFGFKKCRKYLDLMS